MTKLTGTDLYDLQFDALWQDTGVNPQLAPSAVPSLDKSLKTTNKRVIKAINEIREAVASNNQTVSTIGANVKSALGDVENSPEKLADIQKIDADTISAVISTFKLLAGPDLDNKLEIEHFASVFEAINSLKTDVDTLKVSGGGGVGGSVSGNDGSFLLNL
jgi:hypothetical protein